MPSDHVIEDEPGFVAAVRAPPRWRAPASWCCSASRPTAPHTGYGYIRRGAALAGLRRRLCRRRLHREARRRTPPPPIWPPAPTPGTAASSCSPRAAFLDELARLEPAMLEAATAGARRGAGGPGLPAPRRARPSPGARHLHRLCRDGAHQRGRGAADRRRLERCRLLVVAVGAGAARRARQRRSRRRAAGGHDTTPTSIASGRWSRPSASRTSSSSTPPTRCWWPTAAARRTCRGSSRA